MSAHSAVRYVGVSAFYNGSYRACQIACTAAYASAIINDQSFFRRVDAADGTP